MKAGVFAAMGEKTEARFRALVGEIEYLNNISQTLSWDMRVMMPAAAADYRGQEMGYLAGRIHALETSPEMGELLHALEADPPRDPVLGAMVQRTRREHDRLRKVPEDLFAACAAHTLRTEHLWPRARSENDYELIRPALEQAFAYRRDMAACCGFAHDPLTGLMDQ